MKNKKTIFCIFVMFIVLSMSCGKQKNDKVKSENNSKITGSEDSFATKDIKNSDDKNTSSKNSSLKENKNIWSDVEKMHEIKSITDITEDMIKSSNVSSFDKQKMSEDGDYYYIDYEGFSGAYCWIDLRINKKTELKISQEDDMDANSKLAIVLPDGTFEDIKESSEYELSAGEAKIVLYGYRSTGKIKLSLSDNSDIDVSTVGIF